MGERRFRRAWTARLTALLSVCLLAPLTAQNLEDRVVEHTLDNGMKLLILQREQSPTVALNIWVKAGGVDEPIGKTGIAHMLEHMLFKGTKTLGTTNYDAEAPLLEELDKLYEEHDMLRDHGESDEDAVRLAQVTARIEEVTAAQREFILNNQLDEIYSYHGSVGLNAATGKDYTFYTISLPSNKIELWMRLESERMRDPIFREFYVERDVVMEERRQTTESNPGRKLLEVMSTVAFAAHPYGAPTIGWMSDINRLKRKEAEAFFKTYYAPNNAVVSIVGDVEPEWVIERMTHYFAGISPQEIPERIGTVEPKQEGERRVEVEFDAESEIYIGYHKPSPPHFDDYVFDMISSLMSDGRTSRLYKSLIEEKQLAVDVGCYNGYPGARYDNLFIIYATPRHPHTAADVEAAIYEELDRLANGPIDPREMEKVRNQMQAGFIRGLDSNLGMARQLGEFEVMTGSWRYVVEFMDNVSKITEDDVRRAIKQYLTKSNRTVGILVKPPIEEGDEAAEMSDESMMEAQ